MLFVYHPIYNNSPNGHPQLITTAQITIPSVSKSEAPKGQAAKYKTRRSRRQIHTPLGDSRQPDWNTETNKENPHGHKSKQSDSYSHIGTRMYCFYFRLTF